MARAKLGLKAGRVTTTRDDGSAIVVDVSTADALAHCGCFGVIDGVPCFAVKPVPCGHWFDVRRERIQATGGSIYRQVIVPTSLRARPLRSLALGMRVAATSFDRVRNILRMNAPSRKHRPNPRRKSA